MPVFRIAKSLAKKVLRRNNSNKEQSSDSNWTNDNPSKYEQKSPEKTAAVSEVVGEPAKDETPLNQVVKKSAPSKESTPSSPEKNNVSKANPETKKDDPEEMKVELIQTESVQEKEPEPPTESSELETPEEAQVEAETTREADLENQDLVAPADVKTETETAESELVDPDEEQAVYSFSAHGIIPETCPSCGASSHNNWHRDGQDFVCGSCEEPYS